MTTSTVTSVTDELIADLDEACREHRIGFMIEAAEVRALLADRDELKRDAARYRWLRESMWYVGPDNFFCGEGGDMNDYENHNYRADTLDAAIDAAMQS